MKNFIIILAFALLPQVVLAENAIIINDIKTTGVECNKNDYTFFQGYRMFWSYVHQSKPKGYPNYWHLVPEIYVNGYAGSVCKNVVKKGYGVVN